MFSETKKYKNNDHFFFRKGDSLPDVSQDVPELPGIFYVIRLARGGIDLVYISRSGMLSETLRDKINITPLRNLWQFAIVEQVGAYPCGRPRIFDQI